MTEAQAQYETPGVDANKVDIETTAEGIEIQVKRLVPFSTVSGWATTMIEGGSSYWIAAWDYGNEALMHGCRAKISARKERGPVYDEADYWQHGGTLLITDDEGQSRHISAEDLVNALKHENVRAETVVRLLEGQYDALDTDLLLQIACFGEVVYG